jgi:hypothetical protein
VCAVSEVLCLVSDGHYNEFGNSSVSGEEKERCAHETCVSYLRRREMHPHNARLVSEKGDAPTQRASPFYLICIEKNIYKLFSTGCPLRQHAACPLAHIHECMCPNGHPTSSAQEAPRGAQGA